MYTFTWNPEFGVGVSHLDEQHKELFAILNEYYTAIVADQAKEAAGSILARLVEYATHHFSDEERLMASNGYSGFRRHKAEHDRFVSSVLDFQKRLHQGKILLSMEVTGFLKDWLTSHIKGEDKKYGPFLNGKGIS